MITLIAGTTKKIIDRTGTHEHSYRNTAHWLKTLVRNIKFAPNSKIVLVSSEHNNHIEATCYLDGNCKLKNFFITRYNSPTIKAIQYSNN